MNTLNFEGKTYQLTEIVLKDQEPPKKPESVNTSKTIWDLDVGDKYWTIHWGFVSDTTWNGTSGDIATRNQGNCFLTKPEAEKELKKRQAIQKIRKYIHDEGMEWEFDPEKDNWLVLYVDDTKRPFQAFKSAVTRGYNFINHLESESHAKKIIDNFPDELKLIFDV